VPITSGPLPPPWSGPVHPATSTATPAARAVSRTLAGLSRIADLLAVVVERQANHSKRLQRRYRALVRRGLSTHGTITRLSISTIRHLPGSMPGK
jgi:hypothetical protein